MPSPLPPSDDSAALHEALTIEMEKRGRGAQSWAARELGMTPSAFRKRMLNPEKAFDSPSLRAAILVMELRRADEAPERSERIPAPPPQSSSPTHR